MTTPIKLVKNSSASAGRRRESSCSRSRSRSATRNGSDSDESEGTEISLHPRNDDYPSEQTEGSTSDSDVKSYRRSRQFHRQSGGARKRYRRGTRSRSRSPSKRARRKIEYASSSSSESESDYVRKILALIKKDWKERRKKRKRKSHRRSRSRSTSESRSRSRSRTPKRKHKRRHGEHKGKKTPEVPKWDPLIVKSPSDTTIYAPAITKAQNKPGQINNNNDKLTPNAQLILDFIKWVRVGEVMNKDGSSTSGSGSTGGSTSGTSEPSGVAESQRRAQQARAAAEAAVLEAERYKANLQPQGRQSVNPTVNLDPDDTFCHINCHIDPGIVEKIEKGLYVDLEKLLRKDKGFLASLGEDEEKLELKKRTEDGVMYCVTKSVTEKINSVQRWDKAFRIYASIYTRAQPHRSAEIWQYIDSIHRAARTFPWHNVANYDFLFRHLMQEYPDRKWGKTYTQKYTELLCEGNVKTNNGSGNSNGGGSRKSGANKPCWKYNKSKCTYKNCMFEHRCSYCGAMGHPYQSCFKCKNKGQTEGGESKGKKPKDREQN